MPRGWALRILHYQIMAGGMLPVLLPLCHCQPHLRRLIQHQCGGSGGAGGNQAIPDSENVKIVKSDIRAFIGRTKQKYDVILLNMPSIMSPLMKIFNPWSNHIWNWHTKLDYSPAKFELGVWKKYLFIFTATLISCRLNQLKLIWSWALWEQVSLIRTM